MKSTRIWERCKTAFRYGTLCAAAILVFGGLSASAQQLDENDIPYIIVDGINGNDAYDGNTLDSAVASLQHGIDRLVAAYGGWGYILVNPGTYGPINTVRPNPPAPGDDLQGYPAHIKRAYNIAFFALGPRESTIIDGGGEHRCATLADVNGAKLDFLEGSDWDNATVLVGFTLQNGKADLTGAEDWGDPDDPADDILFPNEYIGGGVYGGTLDDCIIRNSYARTGGGGAALSYLIGGTIVSNNVAVFGGGGGVLASTMEDCFVIDNSAPFGGGVNSCHVLSSWVLNNTAYIPEAPEDSFGGGATWSLLSNSWVIANTSFGDGGGAAYGHLLGTTLCYNEADGNGGAVFEATLIHTVTASNNVAGVNGGGFYGCQTATNVWLDSNSAFDGGGAYDSTITDGVMTNNVAAGNGGGAYGSRLTNCNMLCNEAANGDGGGVYDCTVSVDHDGGSWLVGNKATHGNGGGAAFSDLKGCGIVGNFALFNGGGAYMGSLLFATNTVENKASGVGGGVYGSAVTNSALIANEAQAGGGGAAEALVVNSLLTSNVSHGNGGGALDSILYNCTLAFNTFDLSGNTITDWDSAGVGNSTCYNSIVLGNFYVSDTWKSSNGTKNSTFNNSCISETPVLSGSGNLVIGDPARVFVDFNNGDLHLAAGAPCIGTGNNAYVPAGWLIDLDGNARIQQGTVDMGCYESDGAGAVILNVTLNPDVGYVQDTSNLVVVVGGKYTGLPEAERYGYTSKGWRLDGSPITESSDVTALTNHTLVVEGWTPKTVTVWADTNNDGIAESYDLPFDSDYSDGIKNLVPPPGYEFDGWQNEDGHPITTITTGDSHTVIPVWSAKTINVTLDPGVGYVQDSSNMVVTVGRTYAGLPQAKRYGYDSRGWILYGNTITAASGMTQTTNHILTVAGWTPKTVIVGLDIDGDGIADKSYGLPFDSEYSKGITDLVPPTGYEFDGWRDAYGNPTTTITTENSHTVTPVWRWPVSGTFSDVTTQLYAKYDATDELWNGPQIVATFTPTSALSPGWPNDVTVAISLSAPDSGVLDGRLEYIDGAWRVVAGNNIPSGIIHLGYSPDKAHHLNLTITVSTNTATFPQSVMVNYHPEVTESVTPVAEGMSNVKLGVYSPNEWELAVWEGQHPASPDSGHFIENRLTNGTPVTVIVGPGGTRIDAWLANRTMDADNYWTSDIIGNIPVGLSGTGLSATYYFGGIDTPSWVYNGSITIEERDSYEFTLFPQVIYAELLNQYAGTYKPEQYADVDWATRQTIVTLNNQYTLSARLVPLGDGTARIILNEALDVSAVAPAPYSQTNCVVLAGNPETISDPPNQVGDSDTKVRIYRKPVIDLNDTLNPDTDNPDGDEVIGTFTPPTNGGYDGDILPLNGEIPVLFKIYRYNGNAPAGEDPDSAYVDTEYKGYVVNRGDATGYRICLIDPLPIIPPGTWYLGIATDESRLAAGQAQRSFGRYAFTVDMARIGLTGAVTAQETGPVLIGTYTPNPDYGFGDWTTFDVVITIIGTDYAGHIDSARRVYINDANFASIAAGSYDIRVVARGLFEDGDLYTVAITESRFPFGEEEPDGDDGIDVIDPGAGAGLTITAIRVYQDGDGREWVDIDVTGCKNYSKDYALFGRDELIAKAAHDTDDEIRADGLTVSELSTGALLRYAPSKTDIIGLGAMLPATNANGDWTFTFPKPASDRHFYHAREVSR